MIIRRFVKLMEAASRRLNHLKKDMMINVNLKEKLIVEQMNKCNRYHRIIKAYNIRISTF